MDVYKCQNHHLPSLSSLIITCSSYHNTGDEEASVAVPMLSSDHPPTLKKNEIKYLRIPEKHLEHLGT